MTMVHTVREGGNRSSRAAMRADSIADTWLYLQVGWEGRTGPEQGRVHQAGEQRRLLRQHWMMAASLPSRPIGERVATSVLLSQNRLHCKWRPAVEELVRSPGRPVVAGPGFSTHCA